MSELFLVNRASPKDEQMSSSEQRHSPFSPANESSGNARDPFVLQSQSKNSHQQINSPSSNIDRNWQSYVQYQQSMGSRSSRSVNTSTAGSIKHGTPMSPPTRPSPDSQQHPSTANNQLVNPRYSCVNKGR